MRCDVSMEWYVCAMAGSLRYWAYRYAGTGRDYFLVVGGGEKTMMTLTLRRLASLSSTGSRPKTRCGDGECCWL